MTEIHLDVDANVATITLDGPLTRNALSPESARRFVEVCGQVDADGSIGAAVICGANETFCSGAERQVLQRVSEDPAEPGRYTDMSAVYSAFSRLGKVAVPTLAAVRGAAVGAGVNLLLATDLRIVAKDARIITGFMNIGIHPGGGHFALLNRVVGWEATVALSVFGEEISGARAAEVGLAWNAVDASEVGSRARELALRVAADPELSRSVIRSMRMELGPPPLSWEASIDIERAPQMWSLRRRLNDT